MSRQFSFYLLPSDIEFLLAELRIRVGVKIIQETSSQPETIELESPICKEAFKLANRDAVSVRCCLVPPNGADIRIRFIATQSYWLVENEPSEVIEFSGCAYDGKNLMIGRCYFHTDVMIGDEIWPKRSEFLKWADRVFKTMKKLLHYSKAMEAYVGKDAVRWRKESGGQFISLIRRDGEPIYAVE